MPVRSFDARDPFDLVRTMRPLAVGADPTMAFGGDEVWWSSATPAGPVTVRFNATGSIVTAEAWGAGAGWALERAPAICGAADDPTAFEPKGTVGRMAGRVPGLRLTRTQRVFQSMLHFVLAQKVTSLEAGRGFRRLVRALGSPAPGPRPLIVAPAAADVAGLAYTRFHPWGIERKRAQTVINLARRAGRLEETCALAPPDAVKRLLAFPGVGPWTAGLIGLTVLGDPDAVPVGDYHLPSRVAWALAGEERADDARMLELLEPYAPHRGRVIRLVSAIGRHAPRYGPRMPARSFERH